jgi:hypothetical protein
MASSDMALTIARMSAAIGELGTRVDDLEEKTGDCDCEELRKSVASLTRWVGGDAELGVPNLRAQVNELYLTHQRLKWTAALLGILSGGTAVGAINFILGG